MKRTVFGLVAALIFLAVNGFTAVAQQAPLTEKEQAARDKAFAWYRASLADDPRTLLELSDSQTAEILELTVDDSLRRAVVVRPKDLSRPAPVVFVYHGRGGLLSRSMNTLSIYRHWPEAIIVYSQGLWIDGGKKIKWGTGWKMPSRKDVGRDVRLFDAQLAYLTAHFPVDTSRIFAMGHSNGGSMTYGVWSFRGQKLAGVCISGCSSNAENPAVQRRAAKPAFFLLAEDDHLVDSDKYKAYIRYIVGKQTDGVGVAVSGRASASGDAGVDGRANAGRDAGVDGRANASGDAVEAGQMLRYEAAADGAEVMTFFYPGRHRFTPAALPYIVDFFQRQRK